MKIDVAGILAAIIIFGLVSMAGASMGLILFIIFLMIKNRTIDYIAIGSEMSNLEIGCVTLIGAVVGITFFMIEFKKGNIR